MDWDDPAERFRLIESVGPEEYNRLLLAHFEETRIATVNGYGIRPVNSRFGKLFFVEGTNTAFSTQAEAEEFARTR